MMTHDEVKTALPNVLPLVRFECGCVGLTPNAQGQAVIIQCCDDRILNNDLGLCLRDMRRKTHEPLADLLKVNLFYELQKLINQGYQFRELRSLLRE